jgi:hypothetical protein
MQAKASTDRILRRENPKSAVSVKENSLGFRETKRQEGSQTLKAEAAAGVEACCNENP